MNYLFFIVIKFCWKDIFCLKCNLLGHCQFWKWLCNWDLKLGSSHIRGELCCCAKVQTKVELMHKPLKMCKIWNFCQKMLLCRSSSKVQVCGWTGPTVQFEGQGMAAFCRTSLNPSKPNFKVPKYQYVNYQFLANSMQLHWSILILCV